MPELEMLLLASFLIGVAFGIFVYSVIWVIFQKNDVIVDANDKKEKKISKLLCGVPLKMKLGD